MIADPETVRHVDVNRVDDGRLAGARSDVGAVKRAYPPTRPGRQLLPAATPLPEQVARFPTVLYRALEESPAGSQRVGWG